MNGIIIIKLYLFLIISKKNIDKLNYNIGKKSIYEIWVVIYVNQNY